MRYLVPLLLIILTACATSSAAEPVIIVTATPAAETERPPELLVADSILSTSENRLAFALWSIAGRLPAARDLTVRIRPNAASAVMWEGVPTQYVDHDGPYWVAYPELADLQTALLEVTYTNAAGQPITLTHPLTLTPAAEYTPGSAAPRTDSPIWTGEGDIHRVSTDREANPAFYQQSIAQSLDSGRPSLILFATPAICTRKICAPVMDSFKSLWAQYGGQFNFVHVESISLETGDASATLAAWGLTTAQQPLLVVTDAAGMILARYDALFSVAELAPLLEPLTTDMPIDAPVSTASAPLEERIVSNLPNSGPAPELNNTIWLNTDAPLRLADLRGKVVLLEMWTFDCINCIRTLPYVISWHNEYASQGLVVIGNHYPEFNYEADLGNLEAAIARLGVTYPVAQDNDGATWRAYNNRYWPTLYLIDKWGNIRYQHIGEGAYSSTEHNIRELLAESYP